MYRRWEQRFGPHRTFPLSDTCCRREASVCFPRVLRPIDEHLGSCYEALLVVPSFVHGIHQPCPSIPIALPVLGNCRRIEDEHAPTTGTHTLAEHVNASSTDSGVWGEKRLTRCPANRRANVDSRRGGSSTGTDPIGSLIGRRCFFLKRGGKTGGRSRQDTSRRFSSSKASIARSASFDAHLLAEVPTRVRLVLSLRLAREGAPPSRASRHVFGHHRRTIRRRLRPGLPSHRLHVSHPPRSHVFATRTSPARTARPWHRTLRRPSDPIRSRRRVTYGPRSSYGTRPGTDPAAPPHPSRPLPRGGGRWAHVSTRPGSAPDSLHHVSTWVATRVRSGLVDAPGRHVLEGALEWGVVCHWRGGEQ